MCFVLVTGQKTLGRVGRYIYFFNYNFFSRKKIIFMHFESSGNTIRVSNSLELDQAGCFVRHDLGPNCLQRLSADDTSRQRVNPLIDKGVVVFCPVFIL